MMKEPRIVLLCTGRTAVPALHRLAALGVLQAVAVTDSDPAVGVLMQQQAAAVQRPFHRITRTGLRATLEALCDTYQPDVVFVIGFSWRIPAAVLSKPPLGFLNFHGGPLPELRGPDPIFEAIRQQLPTTALTVHRMDAEFDTGPVVLEDRFPLPADLTYGLLCTQMAFRAEGAAATLVARLKADGQLPATEQAPATARYWPRVTPPELHLHWRSQPAAALAALIRACNPVYGGAATFLNGWSFRLTDAAPVPGLTHDAPAGTLLELSPERGALIQCVNGEVLQAFVVGTDEGYFPAVRLAAFGLRPGVVLQDPPGSST